MFSVFNLTLNKILWSCIFLQIWPCSRFCKICKSREFENVIWIAQSLFTFLKSLVRICELLHIQPSMKTKWRRSTALDSGPVPARVKVRDKSHRDGSGVSESKAVETKHQTLPCGTQRLANILKDKSEKWLNKSTYHWPHFYDL